MYENYKIIVVTPAGRKCYLELLIPQIIALRSIVDKYVLWVNTTNIEDIQYMQTIASKYSDFIELQYLTVPHNGSLSIYSFFKKCIDPNTVYVRFDDDIIQIDSIESFTKFVKFRIEHPEYFLVYGNILNNAILTHIQQRFGNFTTNIGISGYESMDDIGWKSGTFAENIHRQILSKDLKEFRFDNSWNLYHYERVSINCISWLGEEFLKFNGDVGSDEEQWLACHKPGNDKKSNCIYGGFVCVHYAFYTQRPHLDTTNILESYKMRITS